MAISGIPGLGSGMDIKGMVGALVGAEAAPKTLQLDRLEKATTSKFSALSQFKNAMAEFQESLAKLNDASLFEKRSATSSASDIVGISADGKAVAGNYDVQVFSLAQSSKVALAGVGKANEALGSGTLSISVGDDTLDIDLTDASLTDIRDAINAAGKDSGLSASIVSDPSEGGVSRLILNSDKTGAGNDISVAVSADAGSDLHALAFDPAQLDPNSPDAARVISHAQNAELAIDGINISSTSNTVADAIEGVTLTLKKAQTAEALGNAETVNLGVAQDKGGVGKSIEEFVGAYNKMLDSINSLTKVTPIADGNAEPVSAALVGDSSVRSFMSSMRSELGALSGGEGIRILADLGVTTGRDGKLEVDSDKLTAALDGNFEQVNAFFTGEQGLMARLDAKIEPYTQTGGILESRTKGLQNTLSGVDDQREALGLRLSKLESRLFAQFNAMDQLVAQMSSTSTFLTGALANLPGVVKKDK